MICDRCFKDLGDIKWERYRIYKGLEEHHNPPSFMFSKLEKWEGQLINLCVDCHNKLHSEIIKILNKNSNLLKFCNSEYWVWRRMTGQQQRESKEEVFNFTKDFVKNDT